MTGSHPVEFPEEQCQEASARGLRTTLQAGKMGAEWRREAENSNRASWWETRGLWIIFHFAYLQFLSILMNMHSCLMHFVNGHLGLFSVGALLNKAGVDFACWVYKCGYVFVSLSKYLEVNLTDCMDSLSQFVEYWQLKIQSSSP